MSETSENVSSSALISSFVVCIYVQYFFDIVRNQTCLLELKIKKDQKFMKKTFYVNML